MKRGGRNQIKRIFNLKQIFPQRNLFSLTRGVLFKDFCLIENYVCISDNGTKASLRCILIFNP